VPLMVPLVLLIGIGPLARWKAARWSDIARPMWVTGGLATIFSGNGLFVRQMVTDGCLWSRAWTVEHRCQPGPDCHAHAWRHFRFSGRLGSITRAHWGCYWLTPVSGSSSLVSRW
jgi:hypothetical protein